MNKNIGNLTITSFCKDNIEHIKFIKDLQKDELIYTFVSVDIKNDIKETTSNDIEIGSSYLIAENEKLVGYICLKKIYNVDNVVELRYAVHPKCRRFKYLGYSDENRKGYGQLILEECRDYLLTIDGIDNIELHIRKDNDASIGCAVKSKYKRIGSNDEEYYHIYRSIAENGEL